MVSEIRKRIQVGVAHQINIAAVAAAATVRSSLWNPVFPPEADATVPSFSGNQNDANLVNEQFITRAAGKCSGPPAEKQFGRKIWSKKRL